MILMYLAKDARADIFTIYKSSILLFVSNVHHNFPEMKLDIDISVLS